MIEILFGDERSSYDILANILSIPEANHSKQDQKSLRKFNAEIGKENIRFVGGELTNEFLNLVGTRQILSVNNYDEKKSELKKTKKTESGERKILTGVRLPKIKQEESTKATTKRKPRKMDVWMVDFGEPVGAEFGHPHPAIIMDSPGEGLFNVIPCSKKYREGKDVLELALYDSRVLLDADKHFVQNARGRISYVLFKEKRAVSTARFSYFLGVLDEEYFDQIEKCDWKYENKVLDRPFTLDDLNFSEKQIKMFGNKLEDLIQIGNSEIPYEEKVNKMLIELGFYPQVDEAASFLAEAIRKTKIVKLIDMKQVSRDISRGKIKSADVIQQQLNGAVKKRFKDLYPCTEIFIKSINKMAYYR